MNLAEIPEATAAATWLLLLLLLLRFKIWGPLLLLLLFPPSLSIPQFRRKNCLEMNGNLMVNRFLIGYWGCGRIYICVEAAKKRKKKEALLHARSLPTKSEKFNFVRFQKRVSYYARILRAQNTDLNLFLQRRRPFAKKRDDCLKSPHLAIIIRKKEKKWRRKSSAENWKIEEE